MPKHIQHNTTLNSATSDVSGTLPTDLAVNKIKGKTLDTTAIANNRLVTFISASNNLQFKDITAPVTKLVTYTSTVSPNAMSGTTPAIVMSMELTTAGTYLIEFTTSADISRRGSTGYFALYDSAGNMLPESERLIDGSSTNSTNFMLRWSVYVMGIVTTTTPMEIVSIRSRSSAMNNTVTCYDRSMSALKLN
jgi:hypothetical protein